MKVLSIGDSEMNIIVEALNEKIDREYEEKKMNEYDFSHLRTTRALCKDLRCQEFVERCISYFFDRFVDEGIDNCEIEWLMEDMGIDEEGMRSIFIDMGYEES